MQKKQFQSILVIVNPKSGQVKHKFPIIDYFLGIKRRKNQQLCPTDTIQTVTDFFKDKPVSLTIKTTEYAGHATLLAKEATSQNIDAIIVVGGDGTINEVINGIAYTDVALGVIPFGTANVFSLEFDLPLNVTAACEKVFAGNCKQIDLGKMNDKYFSCMSGIGFDAYVIKKADKYLKRVYGALSYIIIALKEYFRYSFKPIVLTIDNDPAIKQGYFVIIGNSKYYGGQMVFVPQADPTDGYLDVCIFKYKSFINTIFSILKIKLGIKKNPSIEYIQAKQIEIQASGNHSIHIDAEFACNAPAKITVAEQSLWVIC